MQHVKKCKTSAFSSESPKGIDNTWEGNAKMNLEKLASVWVGMRTISAVRGGAQYLCVKRLGDGELSSVLN